jgi:hypothetical protein
VSDRPPLTLGFLTVAHDANGFLGGYLVTNAWGRPVEFRLTTAVQPNRVQQILYGATLHEYIHADLIGKTLVEKTAAQPTLIVTDTPAVLPLRTRIDVPVVLLGGDAATADAPTLTHPRAAGPVRYLLPTVAEKDLIEERLNQVDQAVDLAEPFARIREAITEARKMGVTGRAA